MKNKTILISLLLLVLAATVYFSWSAYQAKIATEEVNKKFREMDEAMKKMKQDSLERVSLRKDTLKKIDPVPAVK